MHSLPRLSGEHLDVFGLINMNGRVYDPLLAQFLSPDPYIQSPDNWLNYNRYGYCLNNPLIYTDPSGEFFWAALPLMVKIGIGIGAGVGAYTGYKIGEANGASGLGMAGYMLGGAAIGGFSGYLGGTIAAGGGMMANTGAIMAGSYVNSMGMTALSNGQMAPSIGFGVASFNFGTGELGYLGKKGNSFMENFGYGLGAFANASDVYGAIMGAYGKNAESVELQSDNHSSVYDKDGNSLLDVGAEKPRSDITPQEAISGDLKLSVDYRNHQASIGENIEASIWNRRQTINNVRLDKLAAYKTQLVASGKGYRLFNIFGGRYINCAGGAAMGLLKSGVLNVPVAIPGVLSMQMYARQFSYLSYYYSEF